MIDYASTAQEILETPPPEPDWVRVRIQRSDKLRDALEKINLREADEQEAIAKHNKHNPGAKREYVQHRVPPLLRLRVVCLIDELKIYKPVPYLPIPLLNLIYDEIQESLFERGGYRRLRDPEEEGRL